MKPARRSASARRELEHVLGVSLAGVRQVEAAQVKTTSSATVIFACMKLYRLLGCHGIEFLPEKGARSITVRKSESSTRWCRSCATGGRRRASGSRRRRRQPRPGRPRPPCASVARTGAAVITGEHTRTRRRAPDGLGDAVGDRLAVVGREPGADARLADLHRSRVGDTAVLDRDRLPEPVEDERIRLGQRLGGGEDEDVLLPRPRVVGPVRRAGQDGALVAHGELVVHQIRDASDRLRRHAEPADEHRVGSGGGGTGIGFGCSTL